MGEPFCGKSYLLNKVMETDAVVASEQFGQRTDKIYFWTKPIMKDTDRLHIFLVGSRLSPDCPGFGTMRDPEFDQKLFSMMYLLSSMLVMNTKGPITEKTFAVFEPIKRLSQVFSVAEEADFDQNDFNMVYFSPKLLWLIRDCESLGRDPQGRPVVGDQHLDYALSNKSVAGIHVDVQSKINDYIKNRECITFPTPKNKPSEEFLASLGKLKERIYSRAVCKQMDGTNITCGMFTTFINEIVENINALSLGRSDSQLPKPFSIFSVWDTVIEKECAIAYVEGTEFHKNFLKRDFLNQDEPFPEAYLDKLTKEIRDESIAKFTKLAYLSQNYEELYTEYLTKLQEYIDGKEDLIYELNDKLLKEYPGLTSNYEKQLAAYVERVSAKLKNGYYGSKNLRELIQDLSS